MLEAMNKIWNIIYHIAYKNKIDLKITCIITLNVK